MSTEDLKQAGLTEEARRVIDAALAFQEEWRDDFYTKTMRTEALRDFLEVVRAYRKSLEPRERYILGPTPTDKWEAGSRLVRDSLSMAPVCLAYSVEAADRIAALLNKEEGSER